MVDGEKCLTGELAEKLSLMRVFWRIKIIFRHHRVQRDSRQQDIFPSSCGIAQKKMVRLICHCNTFQLDQGRNRHIRFLYYEAAVIGHLNMAPFATAWTLLSNIWEAPVGDFATVAQVVFDQFCIVRWSKLGRLCGFDLFLLPHVTEGQRSWGIVQLRLERWLQMCADHNWQVCGIHTCTSI